MKVLAYASYKEHCDLYNKIQGLIAVDSCQVDIAQRMSFYCQKPP